MQQYIDVLLRVRVTHNETVDPEEIGSELDITVKLPEDAGDVYDVKMLEAVVAGECDDAGVLVRRDEAGNIMGTGRDAFIAHQPDVDD